MKRIVSLRNKKTRNQTEHFIIRLNRNQSQPLDLNNKCDLRRIVFVSLHGLFKTWKQCPSHILFSAIVVMPLRKDWIYKPSKYPNQWRSFLSVHRINLNRNSDQRKSFSEFLTLLRWKDSQQLAFFMFDQAENTSSDHHLTAPCWMNLSMRLSAMYDPVTGGTYNPLPCETWWRTMVFKSKFGVKVSSILDELYRVQMKYRSIQEIIYQSNPNSLNPIKLYGQTSDAFVRKSTENLIEFTMDNDDDDRGDWYVSRDYDPHEL
eukprot:281209_1